MKFHPAWGLPWLALMLACALTAAPRPVLPTEHAATPLPPDMTPGGLQAAFQSWASAPGADGPVCHAVWRFEADGRALFAPAVCAESWETTSAWLNRDNPNVAHGDYAVQDSRIWIRLAQFDHVHETVRLRYFTGQICADGLTLSEPAVRGYAGLPSPVTQPALTFARLDPPAALPTACTVTPFEVERRPAITLRQSAIPWSVRTHPGQTCTLTYTDPAGQASAPQITTADDAGLCQWLVAAGEISGQALVTVQVGAVTHTFGLDVR